MREVATSSLVSDWGDPFLLRLSSVPSSTQPLYSKAHDSLPFIIN